MVNRIKLNLLEIRDELRKLADPANAEFLQRYFKTRPGEYGEGDRFLGVRVPQIRRIARSGRDLPLVSLEDLLQSVWHEERLLALLIMVDQYRRSGAAGRDAIYRLYLHNLSRINNWDLVDASAGHILGAHLDPQNLEVLESMALSESVWQRRMAIISTFHWIKEDVFGPTFHLSLMLLEDPHDLVQKAVGWMLREIGERDRTAETDFLRSNYRRMPRTTLRYAIEKFPPEVRQAYLRGEV